MPYFYSIMMGKKKKNSKKKKRIFNIGDGEENICNAYIHF